MNHGTHSDSHTFLGFANRGEDMQASCFKDVAGIEESTLVHDHVSEFKYLGLILFLFRFVVNIKVL